MRSKSAESLLALFLWCLFQINAHGQASTFAYQGTLNKGLLPASGLYDFQFTLFDSSTNGNEIGPVLQSTEAVSNGVFTALLDFGNVLNGSATWLEIGVRPNGNPGAYVILSPRQLLTSVPYAAFAATAGSLNGSLSSEGLAGGYTNSVTLSNSSNVFVGMMVGDGSGLTNITATLSAEALTNDQAGPVTFAGPVTLSGGTSSGGNTVTLSTNLGSGDYTFFGSNISPLSLENPANGVLTNAVAIGNGGLGPQIIIPGIDGDRKMARIFGREGNALGAGGLVIEAVKTNTQTYLDIFPSSTSLYTLSFFNEVSWIDVVDRDLSQPGADYDWEALNIGMSGQGFSDPHGTIGTHAGGTGGVVRDLWINGGNIEFFSGYPHLQRIGQLFSTSSGSGFALCDNTASNAVAQQFAGTVVVLGYPNSPAPLVQLQFPTNSSIEYEFHFTANVVSNPPSTFYHLTYSGLAAFSQTETNVYSLDGQTTNMVTGNSSWSIVPTTNATGVVWNFYGDGTNTVRIKYNIFASGGGQAGTYTY